MQSYPSPPSPMTPPTRPLVPPGRWTTPVRGAVAGRALAWIVGYVAGMLALVVGGILLDRALDGPRPSPAVLALVVFAGTAVAALAAVRIHLLGRRRLTWADVGVRRPEHSPAHLLWQIPATLGAAALVSVAALLPFGGSASDDQDAALSDLTTSGPVFAVAGLLTVAVVVPIAEEIVFRGVVFAALRARFRAVAGTVLGGLVFAVVHFMPPALPYLFVTGVALCAMAEWYRSVLPGMVLHGVNNAIAFATLLVTPGGAGA